MRSLPVVLLIGCAKAPIEAPEDLGELATWMFASFEDDDPAVLAAGVETLEPFLRDLPLDGDIDDRAFSMPVLAAADLGGADAPAGQAAEDQLPVAVAGHSRHGLPTHRGLVAQTNYVCIESNTTTFYRRTHDGDADCFEEGGCDRIDTSNEVRKESILADVWYDLYKDHRALTLQDGRQAMVGRSWIDQVWPADNGSYSWDQFYTLEVWLEDDADTTLRFHTVWSAVHLGPVGGDLYRVTVNNAIDEGFVNGDNFVDGVMCDNPRDRAYDRG